jgi:ComEC/Rec2-related protein
MISSCYQFIAKFFKTTLEQEYHNLSLWYFVSFIAGIISYFSLNNEPSLAIILTIFMVALSLIIFRTIRENIFGRFISSLIIAFTLGMLIGKFRVANLHITVIERPVILKIQGEIESIKPTTYGMQVLLQQVKIDKLNQFLEKVRISIPAKYATKINIGDTIKILACLDKPQGAILPNGYDFGFYAYVASIGANGYSMSSPEVIAYSDLGANSLVYKIKKNIYNRLIQVLGKIKGNFTAAILLGETKALDRNLMREIRLSGISHILCVSGLHLSLVAMIFFIASRFLLNLSNYLAYNYNIKIIAAICSLIGSYGYLELSGRQIAATRAFIMTAIFIYAVMIGRTTYSIRSLAIAASIILSINPEYIFHPSFQLSFIAVLSLTFGYEFYLKNQWLLGRSKGIIASIKFYIASNIYSSFLASIITAPVVISQFYSFATYSIPMNLIAVPIMSFFLMPLAIIALFLMIFGIDYYCLKLMGFFIDIILTSVKFVNQLPRAVWYFGYITNFSLISFLLGFLWLGLWKTVWRLFGIIIMAISVMLMFNTPKPDVIFDMQLKALAIKNSDNQLEIYANKMPEFKHLYWANWFGQKDAKIHPLENNIFSSNGIIILLDSEKVIADKACQNVDVHINILNNIICKNSKIMVNRDSMIKSKIIIIFCDQNNCRIETSNRQRFSFY